MTDEPDLLGYDSVSELARRRGVDKAAVSRRVARLERQGLIHPVMRGGRKLVSVAEFTRAAGDTVDAIREANGRAAAKPTETSEPRLAREQARSAAIIGDLRQLDLDARVGKLMAVEAVREAMTGCAATLARLIDALPGHAERMASAVGNGGVSGARAALKELARELREDLSQAMTLEAERDDEGAAEPRAEPAGEAA